MEKKFRLPRKIKKKLKGLVLIEPETRSSVRPAESQVNYTLYKYNKLVTFYDFVQSQLN
jgi:hypothetical protein